MPAIAFFPWYTIEHGFEIENHILTPYRRGHDENIDRLLESYHDQQGRPIDTLTLLSHSDRGLLWEPTERDIDDILQLSSLIAFIQLAQRPLFARTGYTNHGTYQCVVQRFREGERGVTIFSKRRDGRQTTYYQTIKHVCPPNVPRHTGPIIAPHLVSLLSRLSRRTESSDLWKRLEGAIWFFGNANTDSDSVPLHMELVLLVSAFERLLNIRDGQERTLAERVRKLFENLPSSSLEGVQRRLPISIQKNSRSVKEAWIRDCFQTRGAYAHGHKPGNRQLAWLPMEHAILATSLFPLAVKALLAEEDHYALNEEDLIESLTFDLRASEAILFTEDQLSRLWPWQTAREKALAKWFVRGNLDRSSNSRKTRDHGARSI